MNRFVLALPAVVLSGMLIAQAPHSPSAHNPTQPAPPKADGLVTGYGDLHHPVTTTNPEAQKFFDQGLRYIYAFNHDEAKRSFEHASQLDPKLAMAYWGIAESVGPNYNDPADPDRFKQAHEAIQKAVGLSSAALSPASRDISRRWPCAFRRTRTQTCAKPRSNPMMPCVSW